MGMIFLAKLIGFYLIVVGLIAALRQSSVMPAIADLIKNRALVVLFAFIELAAGLALLVANPVVTPDWVGVIALVGWMMVIEGTLYLSLPFRMVQRIIRPFNRREWYIGGGLLSVALGAYLVASGFGLL